MNADGKLWVFLRNMLSQGMAIQQDNDAGKYPTYEHLSARLDEAARERVDEWNRRSPTGGQDAEDAARYRFIRQPNNAIVYAIDPNAWGLGKPGNIKWVSPELLDAGIDAAMKESGK